MNTYLLHGSYACKIKMFRYSYGKKVLGNMNATVCLERMYGWYNYGRPEKKNKPACMTFHKSIDGCANINVELGILKNMLPKSSTPKGPRFPYYEPSSTYILKYSASVVEKATGTTKNDGD